MGENDFFIGWKGEVPSENKKPIRRFTWVLILLALLLCCVVVVFQKPFTNHIFELGNITTISGIYLDEPFPMLLADTELPEGTNSSEVLLVGYGKNGAEGIMDEIQKNENMDLSGRKVELQGTMIYGDGKTLMELTKKDKSLIQASGKSNAEKEALGAFKQRNSYSGEIIDPKCYFGVMKPGIGKVHKSCAIRCISGGIPPVLRTEEDGRFDYYLMLDNQGDRLDNQVLQYVAEPVIMDGEEAEWNGWKVLYVDMNSLQIVKN